MKTFQESGCLLFSTVDFCIFIEQLESAFGTVFKHCQQNSYLLRTLVVNAEKECRVSNCGQQICTSFVKQMVHRYMNLRGHFELKVLSRAKKENKTNIKRNKKAKKICHE